jgi:hypothetical protein
MGMNQADVEDADGRFFRGVSNELAPFKLPVARPHEEPGQFPWWELDEAGLRLIRFAHRFGSYDWMADPDRGEQVALLRALASGQADDPVEGDYDLLWKTLFAVAREDRFSEGVVANNLLALTRVANELRRRLLAQRSNAQ